MQRFVEIIVKCDQRHSIVLLSLKIKYDLHFHVVCDMSSESQCSRTLLVNVGFERNAIIARDIRARICGKPSRM